MSNTVVNAAINILPNPVVNAAINILPNPVVNAAIQINDVAKPFTNQVSNYNISKMNEEFDLLYNGSLWNWKITNIKYDQLNRNVPRETSVNYITD
jgi:hypothetical protein